jgi:hypothetical protein
LKATPTFAANNKVSEKRRKSLTSKVGVINMAPLFAGLERFVGGIAQLGERLHGMQEVSGSIPLISTKTSLNEKNRILLISPLN